MIAITLEHTGQMNKEALGSVHSSFWLVRFLNKIGIKSQYVALQADTYLFIIYVLVILNKLELLLILLSFIFNFYWLAISILIFRRKNNDT